MSTFGKHSLGSIERRRAVPQSESFKASQQEINDCLEALIFCLNEVKDTDAPWDLKVKALNEVKAGLSQLVATIVVGGY